MTLVCAGYASLDDCTAYVHVCIPVKVCNSQITFYCDAIHNLSSIVFVNKLFSLFSSLSICTVAE